jgi:hypothetical protein
VVREGEREEDDEEEVEGSDVLIFGFVLKDLGTRSVSSQQIHDEEMQDLQADRVILVGANAVVGLADKLANSSHLSVHDFIWMLVTKRRARDTEPQGRSDDPVAFVVQAERRSDTERRDGNEMNRSGHKGEEGEEERD